LVRLDGAFDDPNIPNSYSPFNIQNLGGKLYVLYAQQNHREPDEETDDGAGSSTCLTRAAISSAA
jgi:hypothetical protein